MRHALLTAALAALALTAGCDRGTTDREARNAQPVPAEVAAHPDNAPSKMQVTPPTPDPTNPPASSGPGTPSVAPAANAPVTPNNPTTAIAAPTAQFSAADIQPQFDQAMQYIKDKKYDLAEKALNQLDQQKSTWSTATQQTWGPKIDSLRKALTASKSGSSALDALKGFTSSPSNTAPAK